MKIPLLFKHITAEDELAQVLTALNLSIHETSALTAILREYLASKKKHPAWPRSTIYGVSFVSREYAQLINGCLEYAAREENNDDRAIESYDGIMDGATQVAAMGLRFLANLIR